MFVPTLITICILTAFTLLACAGWKVINRYFINHNNQKNYDRIQFGQTTLESVNRTKNYFYRYKFFFLSFYRYFPGKNGYS